jgi:hypothetical protein
MVWFFPVQWDKFLIWLTSVFWMKKWPVILLPTNVQWLKSQRAAWSLEGKKSPTNSQCIASAVHQKEHRSVYWWHKSTQRILLSEALMEGLAAQFFFLDKYCHLLVIFFIGTQCINPWGWQGRRSQTWHSVMHCSTLGCWFPTLCSQR